MTRSFMADLSNFEDATGDALDAIFRQSVQDVGEAALQPEDGLMRGAPFKEGILPVDEGELLASTVIGTDGSTLARGSTQGPPDFAAAISGLDTGETVIIAATAPYARAVEYGYEGVPGRFFMTNAAQQWTDFVYRNVARYRT